MNIINYYFLYVFYIDSAHYEIMCDIKSDIVFTGEWDSLGVRFNNGNTT